MIPTATLDAIRAGDLVGPEAIRALLEQYDEDRERIRILISERDHWQGLAQRSFRLQARLARALGVDTSLSGDEQIQQALETIRGMRR
jgi:hypothetical protein